jgi:von Willebrand factor type A domain
MEPVRSRIKWKDIVIAVLALALLALFVWLFLRPAQPARDIVFGDLGRRPGASNAVAEAQAGAVPGAPANPASASGPMATNAPPGSEPGRDQNDQSAGRVASAPLAAQAGQGMGPGDSSSNLPANGSPGNSNSPASSPSSNQAPSQSAPPPSPSTAPRVSAQRPHSKPAPFEDNYPPPPDPANKASTATLLAAAKAAGRGPDNPSPARTEDLLRNDGAPSRMFDAEAGSNVVFLLDNSLSMMTNGKSLLARQSVAWTLASMNARQTFYVLLFHSGGYEGMPSLGPVPATPENVRAMTNWLFNVGHRTGADPTKAVQRALGLAPAPDTVWLLSDSEMPDQVVDNIREANASVNAHVNTIAFYSRAGEQGLRRVADENRGAYRFIPPPNAPAP